MNDLDFGGRDEKAFLDEIRRRLRRDGPKEAHPGSSVWPADIEERFGYEEKAARFRMALEGLGGRVIEARKRADGYEQAVAALVAKGARRILVSALDWSGCEPLLERAGIEVDRWDEIAFGHGGADRATERADAWDAGLDWADFAVADLGSLVYCASPEQGRSINLVPPLHVAFVAREALVFSRRAVLEAVSKRSRTGRGPAALTFVTGPSRSADIEMDLSVGVHGPGEVIAVLIEEASARPGASTGEV